MELPSDILALEGLRMGRQQGHEKGAKVLCDLLVQLCLRHCFQTIDENHN